MKPDVGAAWRTLPLPDCRKERGLGSARVPSRLWPMLRRRPGTKWPGARPRLPLRITEGASSVEAGHELLRPIGHARRRPGDSSHRFSHRAVPSVRVAQDPSPGREVPDSIQAFLAPSDPGVTWAPGDPGPGNVPIVA